MVYLQKKSKQDIVEMEIKLIKNQHIGGLIYSKSKYQFLEEATSTTEYAWDAGFSYKDYLNYDIKDFAMNVTDQGRFLSDGPSTRNIGLNEVETLSSFNDEIVGSEDIYRAVFKSYLSDGTLIDTFSNVLFSSTKVWARLEVGVGTRNMEGNLDLTNASYYTVHYEDSDDNILSEVITYKIDYECSRYTPRRFKFLNKKGGWDFFTFTLRSDKQVNIERANYRSSQSSFNSTNNRYDYTMGDRGNTTFNVRASDTESVNSNWLSNDEASWLEELFTSPVVFLLENTPTDVNEVPINITDTSLLIGKKENRGLINYTITYDYSYDKIIQRR
jgi:hypothetical protein